MASNLRVDTILPSTGTSLGIGTASGTTTVTNNLSVTGSINAASATITGNLGVAGVLTYEDVTNIDSLGIVTARSGINCTGIITATQNFGNVGIDLHATDSGRGSQVKFHNDHGTSFVGVAGDTSGNLLIYNQSNTDIIFYTSAIERLRIDSSGNVTKPSNPAFRARASSGGWKSFGNTAWNTMPFDAEDFDSGGNYNTSTYKFTIPVAGRYYFYAQLQHDGTTANGGNSGKIRIYVGSDIVAWGKSSSQGETVSCGTVWDCTVGEEVYCQGATNPTNADDWHGDSYYSYFTGYLVG